MQLLAAHLFALFSAINAATISYAGGSLKVSSSTADVTNKIAAVFKEGQNRLQTLQFAIDPALAANRSVRVQFKHNASVLVLNCDLPLRQNTPRVSIDALNAFNPDGPNTQVVETRILDSLTNASLVGPFDLVFKREPAFPGLRECHSGQGGFNDEFVLFSRNMTLPGFFVTSQSNTWSPTFFRSPNLIVQVHYLAKNGERYLNAVAVVPKNGQKMVFFAQDYLTKSLNYVSTFQGIVVKISKAIDRSIGLMVSVSAPGEYWARTGGLCQKMSSTYFINDNIYNNFGCNMIFRDDKNKCNFVEQPRPYEGPDVWRMYYACSRWGLTNQI